MADDKPSGPPILAPCAMVIFGATGDLTKRLIVPALYNLARAERLPADFVLIGVARAENTAESWREALLKALGDYLGVEPVEESAWNRLTGKMFYVRGDLAKPEPYVSLRAILGDKNNAIFYLAIADRQFGEVIGRLGGAGLTDQGRDARDEHRGWRRVVIEKPFGHDLASARALDSSLKQTLTEDQIFRIDHFLGKETVQSIMAVRFANGMFEPIWNRDRIDHVQITASETVGVEARGAFYEATGALRDMVPNHALSLVSMVAMEPPVSFDADAIRDKKAEVFAAMPAVRPTEAVRGQYGPGAVLGKAVRAYRDEPGVAAESNTETYVALRFEIDNWRWAGVPFYFRTGKHMSARATEIAIRFKPAPHAMFKTTPVEALRCNWLVLSIAPDEGISLQFEVKRPGSTMELSAVKMDFQYADWFEKAPNVGYETLLHDVMIGDSTLFMRADMVEQTWRIVQPLLEAWAETTPDFPNYDSGGDGPKAADALLGADGGRAWRRIYEAGHRS